MLIHELNGRCYREVRVKLPQRHDGCYGCAFHSTGGAPPGIAIGATNCWAIHDALTPLSKAGLRDTSQIYCITHNCIFEEVDPLYMDLLKVKEDSDDKDT